MPFASMSEGPSRNATRFRATDALRRRAAITVVLATTLGTAVSAASPRRQQTPAAAPVPSTSPAAASPAPDTVRRATVTIVADGQSRDVLTGADTISHLFKEINFPFGKQDRCVPKLAAPIKDGLRIEVTRIRTETTVEYAAIPFKSRQKFTGNLPTGSRSIQQPGRDGEKAIKYLSYYKDNKLTEKEKIAEFVTTPAREQVELIGTRGMTLASRGFFGGRRIIEMVATGYGPRGNGRWGARTSSGLRPGFGVVAVDPHFIPLGTRLYIDGYGYAVAGDTGGAIKGNRIDLGHDSEAAAAAVGRKKVRVLILD